MTMAVPVSWHPGRTLSAAMQALRSSSSATKRSFCDDSGSSMTLRSWARWPGRSRCATSSNATRATARSASGSTFSISAPSTRIVDTPSEGSFR